jgi:hypothetical protein
MVLRPRKQKGINDTPVFYFGVKIMRQRDVVRNGARGLGQQSQQSQ